MNTYIEINVTDKEASRLDKFLVNSLEGVSRTRVQFLIKEGHVCMNGAIVRDPSFKVKQGDLLNAEIIPLPISEGVKAKKLDLPIDVIYEDEYLAVINKPSGLTVHPGAGTHDNTLVNALLDHYDGKLSSVSGQTRPGIVHRLDRNTSGLLIIAKDDAAHLKLSNLLRERKIKRIYNAIIWGTPEKMQGLVEANVGRNQKNRKKMSVQVVGGKHAITHYKVLKIFHRKAAALLECQLETGRTHQIRVHLSHIGHPIVGDPEYGSLRTKRVQRLPDSVALYIRTISRQMLHAKRIIFAHPMIDKLIDLEIDLPEDMAKLIDRLE